MRFRSGRLTKFLINRNYARLWYGQAVSTTGNYVFTTTLTLWVATVLAKEPDGHYAAWAPAATSGVFMCAVAAIVTVGPLAGVFVDRWDRRRTMMHTETVRAALTTGLFALAFTPRHDLPTGVWLVVIYVVVFLLNGAGCFFSPARMATIGDVVTGDADRARAAGIGQSTDATASIIGPPLAAPLLFIAGFQWALLFNAASFVVSYLAIRSVDVPSRQVEARPASKLRSEFMEGVRFFAHNRFLVALLGLAVTGQLGTGAMEALDVFFVTRNLHAAAKFFGFMATAAGIGAIIGGLAAGAAVRRIGARTLTWLGAILTGILVLLYARQTVFVPGLLLAGLTLVPATMLNTAMFPLLLKVTPSQYLGRMMAVFGPVNMLASMLSMAVAGLLASTALRAFHATVLGIHMGPIDTIFTASGLLIVAAGLVGMLTLPSGRDIGTGTP
jgi:Na+/melibiose symporter-like transporter